MWILEFGFTGFSARKGKFLGKRKDLPLTTIKCGIATITLMGHKSKSRLIDAMEGLCQTETWLVENSPQLEAAILAAEDRAFKSENESRQRELEYWKAKAHKSHAAMVEAKQENNSLRRCIKIVEPATE